MPEGKEAYVTAQVLGTFGYFDPEYALVNISWDRDFFGNYSGLHSLINTTY